MIFMEYPFVGRGLWHAGPPMPSGVLNSFPLYLTGLLL
jgi:hypothetical protein